MKVAKKGDRVRFSGEFLRSIGAQTGEMGLLRGEVEEVKDYGGGYKLAVIKWDNASEGTSNRACVANLEKCR